MIVFHGSTEIIKKPDTEHSLRPLDFGKGFYVTTVKEQAEKWARRKAAIFEKNKAIVNKYEMSDNFTSLNKKQFDDDLSEWIDFVCNCRDGKDCYKDFDVILGKVANDKVFRVVDMYHQGIWSKERAIKEMKAYPNYDQIVFITQKAIDQLLAFVSFEEV